MLTFNMFSLISYVIIQSSYLPFCGMCLFLLFVGVKPATAIRNHVHHCIFCHPIVIFELCSVEALTCPVVYFL
jgi:hypothetical protein